MVIPEEAYVYSHSHLMKRIDRPDGHYCDGTKNTGGCKNGLKWKKSGKGLKWWACGTCEFNYCEACMRAYLRLPGLNKVTNTPPSHPSPLCSLIEYPLNTNMQSISTMYCPRFTFTRAFRMAELLCILLVPKVALKLRFYCLQRVQSFY